MISETAPDIEIIFAQANGQPIEDEFEQALQTLRRVWQNRGNEIETNGVGFYVDGYTLTGTPIIGEILVTAMDGRSAIIKSASLVAFLERRLSPNVFPEDKPKG